MKARAVRQTVVIGIATLMVMGCGNSKPKAVAPEATGVSELSGKIGQFDEVPAVNSDSLVDMEELDLGEYKLKTLAGYKEAKNTVSNETIKGQFSHTLAAAGVMNADNTVGENTSTVEGGNATAGQSVQVNNALNLFLDMRITAENAEAEVTTAAAAKTFTFGDMQKYTNTIARDMQGVQAIRFAMEDAAVEDTVTTDVKALLNARAESRLSKGVIHVGDREIRISRTDTGFTLWVLKQVTEENIETTTVNLLQFEKSVTPGG